MDIFLKFWDMVAKSDRKRLANQASPNNIVEHNNIPYCDDGHKYHLLDVYHPKNITAPLPVIIDVHGGGWMYGDKELNKNYCLYLAARGYVVFNMSYRLIPEVTMPDQLADVSLALTKIESILDDYPCDKSRVFLTGDSAGGQLAAYASAVNSSQELADLYGFTRNSLNILALGLTSPVVYITPEGILGVYFKRLYPDNVSCAPYYSIIDFDDMLKKAVMPPTYIVTSSGDFIAKGPSLRLARALSSVGVETRISCWEKTNGKNLPHVFSVCEPASEEGDRAISDMLVFFSLHEPTTVKEPAVE